MRVIMQLRAQKAYQTRHRVCLWGVHTPGNQFDLLANILPQVIAKIVGTQFHCWTSATKRYAGNSMIRITQW